MYVAKINNDLYLKKVFEENDWHGTQTIDYKVSNSLKKAKFFEYLDDEDSLIENLKIFGFKFYKLDEIEVNWWNNRKKDTY